MKRFACFLALIPLLAPQADAQQTAPGTSAELARPDKVWFASPQKGWTFHEVKPKDGDYRVFWVEGLDVDKDGRLATPKAVLDFQHDKTASWEKSHPQPPPKTSNGVVDLGDLGLGWSDYQTDHGVVWVQQTSKEFWALHKIIVAEKKKQ